MIRRILISALVVVLIQTSLPVSASAEQPAPPDSEQTNDTTSTQARVFADLWHVPATLDLQTATRALIHTGSMPLQQSRPLQGTARQTTTGGGGSSSHKPVLVVVGILACVGLGIWALETLGPKSNDSRCSSTNPQYCN
jgi:hypothetical protein